MERHTEGFYRSVLAALTIGILLGSCVPAYARHLSPGDSLPEAIADARPGEVITLSPGVYEGMMLIDKSVTLRGSGAGPGSVVIRPAEPNPYPIAQIESDVGIDVRIGNLTFTQPGGPAIQVEGNSNLLLNGVVISGCGGDGLIARGQAEVTIVASVIRGNGAAGIVGFGSPHIVVTDSTVAENGGSGILLLDLVRLTAQRATIIGNGEHGVLAKYNSRLSIAESLIADNGMDGIRLEQIEEMTDKIRGCRLLRNAGFGVRVPEGGCTDEPDPPVDSFIVVLGGGNLIPLPGEPDGNREGGVCPERLRTLVEPEEGE